jgi:hypothetical protein
MVRGRTGLIGGLGSLVLALAGVGKIGGSAFKARDANVSEHLTCCSPCFNRCMEILAGLKQRRT